MKASMGVVQAGSNTSKVEPSPEAVAAGLKQAADVIKALRVRMTEKKASPSDVPKAQAAFDLPLIDECQTAVDEVLLTCRALDYPYILIRKGDISVLNVVW